MRSFPSHNNIPKVSQSALTKGPRSGILPGSHRELYSCLGIREFNLTSAICIWRAQEVTSARLVSYNKEATQWQKRSTVLL